MDRRSAEKVTGGTSTAGRILFPAGAMFVAAYFLSLTRSAIHAYFSPDDLMNLYRSWSFPLKLLVKANLLFFLPSPFNRPMGSVWYRSIFAFADFNPLPFHVVYMMFLLANVGLTYSVSSRLSKSRAIGGLTTLLACYHTRFVGLYFDTGYVYDVLCYFFYFSGLLLYMRARQQRRSLNWREVAACAVLYVCALNSKEMALTLPVFLASYELLYVGRADAGPSPTRWRAVIVTSAVTMIFLIGRAIGHESLLSNAAYQPVFTWDRFMETSAGFADSLLCPGHWFTPARVLLLWVALAAAAWLTKSRTLRFAWLFLMLSPMPIAFVLPRGASQYYIPLFGWALFAATAVLEGATLIFGKPAPGDGPWAAWGWRAVLLVGIPLALYPHQKSAGSYVPSLKSEGEMRSVVEQLHGLRPALPPRARLLFLDDPIDRDVFDMVFIVRLSYRDDSLTVDRAKNMRDKPAADQFAAYDHVFDYQGGHFIEVTRQWSGGPPPGIVRDLGRPQVFHADWTPVTAAHPARAGEVLIIKAENLGPTSPAVAPGQPFPWDPLANALWKVAARVNEEPAEVLQAIGWPHEINRYRVDIRVPEKAKAGMAVIALRVAGAGGESAAIPVRR